MKKNYIQPELYMQLIQTEGLIALSIQDGDADDSDVLVKEEAEDDIWGSSKSEEWNW